MANSCAMQLVVPHGRGFYQHTDSIKSSVAVWWFSGVGCGDDAVLRHRGHTGQEDKWKAHEAWVVWTMQR